MILASIVIPFVTPSLHAAQTIVLTFVRGILNAKGKPVDKGASKACAPVADKVQAKAKIVPPSEADAPVASDIAAASANDNAKNKTEIANNDVEKERKNANKNGDNKTHVASNREEKNTVSEVEVEAEAAYEPEDEVGGSSGHADPDDGAAEADGEDHELKIIRASKSVGKLEDFFRVGDEYQ